MVRKISDAGVIASTNVFTPHQLGKLRIRHNGRDFFVIKNGHSHPIERAYLSKDLRGITKEQLEKYLSVSYLALNKAEDTYTLTLKQRLVGGGPISGAIGYWATKTLCYGTAVAAGGAAIISTGGAIGGAMGTAIASGSVAYATAPISASVAATAAAIGSSTAATAVATEATVAVLSTSTGVTGAVAMVETASLGISAFLTAIPFLP